MTEPLTAVAGFGSAEPGTMVQLLDPQGRRVDDPTYGPLVDALDAATLRQMYVDMVVTRTFDTTATALQRQGELGLWPPCLGQEGAQIGSGHALADHDMVFPAYREHGVARVRGLDLNRLLPVFRGTQHGGWDPHAHNFHVYTFVIASHTLHATGYAMGVQRDGAVGTGDPDRDRAVVAYFGDGATSQGDASEALVFAASNNAPVVFFCQNNQWAISVPTSVQSRVPLVQRGTGFGIPSVRVDGNDPLACYAVTKSALERARSGSGPTFIEAVTYRMGAHTTSDDPTKYRDRAEEDLWRTKDPIARMKAYLESEGIGDDELWARAEEEAHAVADAARTFCRSLPAPPRSAMFGHVYTAPHPLVEAERAEQAELEAALEEAR